jgi:hypothetical protein
MNGQPVSRLTSLGIEAFWQHVDVCLQEQSAGKTPKGLVPELVSPEGTYVESMQSNVTLDLSRQFENRFDFGGYLLDRFGNAWDDKLLDDPGLWAWTAAAYFSQFTSVKVYRQEHYIPLIGPYAKRLGHQRLDYRHCVRTPVMLVRLLGKRAKFFLGGTANRPRGMSQMGDLIEQVLSRQDIFGNERFREVIFKLYQDENGLERVGSTGIPKRKRLKNGKWSQSGKGGIRRLVDGVLPRIKLTYDVYDLSAEKLIELAGSEFTSA